MLFFLMKNSTKLLFLIILMTGSLMAISANSWMMAWMGLEINLLSFIPLMNEINNLKSSESSLKYFLIQALASSILMFSIILSYMKTNMLFSLEFLNEYPNMMIISALILKCGAAPFHFWFPEVMEGLTWTNAMMLMTWQKLAPLVLISYTPNMSMLLSFIILSTMIGALGGLNQTSMRKIMAFSSINHLGWILSAMYVNEKLWILYFMIYSFISINVAMMFNMYKLFHFNQLFSVMKFNSNLKIISMMNLLSLGGLPPFLGFIPKWLIIQELSCKMQMITIFIMIMMTLITLFFYMRMTFSALMLNYSQPILMNNNYKNSMMNLYLLMSFITLFSLPIISMLYLMF
uniref:NADH-ubiquinone oxidoreductase chain 2 n=1 Tax=Micromorphus albipes TaxID=1000630 RepID=A0A7D7A5P6_9MUSC|nr:NADH dehydrogenase subunit 2 [Micromorphus albipes]